MHSSREIQNDDRTHLVTRYLGEVDIPHMMRFEGTTVGGLSGIDYDPKRREWVFISDDRANRAPARMYRARMTIDENGPGGLELTEAIYFRDENGARYEPNAVDPEDIRIDPLTDLYWWCQEGNRPKGRGEGHTVIQPSLNQAARDGSFVGSLVLPKNYLYMDDRGPRRNKSMEAIAFSRNGRNVISALEGPLLEDGPVSSFDTGGVSRITVQTRTGRVLVQYAYRQNTLPGVPQAGQADHGISAVLPHPEDDTRLLTLERTFMPEEGFTCNVFEVETDGATDVTNLDSLQHADFVPVHKRLLADFRDFPLSRVDNLEGMTWGPRLSTGEHTLVLVSDDGFYTQEVTQIVVLAVQ